MRGERNQARVQAQAPAAARNPHHDQSRSTQYQKQQAEGDETPEGELLSRRAVHAAFACVLRRDHRVRCRLRLHESKFRAMELPQRVKQRVCCLRRASGGGGAGCTPRWGRRLHDRPRPRSITDCDAQRRRTARTTGQRGERDSLATALARTTAPRGTTGGAAWGKSGNAESLPLPCATTQRHGRLASSGTRAEPLQPRHRPRRTTQHHDRPHTHLTRGPARQRAPQPAPTDRGRHHQPRHRALCRCHRSLGSPAPCPGTPR